MIHAADHRLQKCVYLRAAAIKFGLDAVPLTFQMFLFQHDKGRDVMTVQLTGDAVLVQPIANAVETIEGRVEKLFGVHSGIPCLDVKSEIHLF